MRLVCGHQSKHGFGHQRRLPDLDIQLFTEYCELREAGSSRVGDDGDTQRLDDHLEVRIGADSGGRAQGSD